MTKSKNHRPLGFCVDIGAPRSVIGKKELNRILNALGVRKISRKRSANRFRFADTNINSLGQVVLPLDTPAGVKPVFVTLDVVNGDIPALLVMYVLDRESLTPDTVCNRLSKRINVTGTELQHVYID